MLREKREKRSGSRTLKAIAFSEISIMLVQILAFAFIFSLSFELSLGSVSGAASLQVGQKFQDSNFDYWTITDIKGELVYASMYNPETGSTIGTGLAKTSFYSSKAGQYLLNRGWTLIPPTAPAASAAPLTSSERNRLWTGGSYFSSSTDQYQASDLRSPLERHNTGLIIEPPQVTLIPTAAPTPARKSPEEPAAPPPEEPAASPALPTATTWTGRGSLDISKYNRVFGTGTDAQKVLTLENVPLEGSDGGGWRVKTDKGYFESGGKSVFTSEEIFGMNLPNPDHARELGGIKFDTSLRPYFDKGMLSYDKNYFYTYEGIIFKVESIDPKTNEVTFGEKYGSFDAEGKFTLASAAPSAIGYKIPFKDTPWTPSYSLGHLFGNMLEGLTWSVTVLGITQLIGNFFPGEKGEQIKQFGLAISAGIMAYKTTKGVISTINTKWRGSKGAVGSWGNGLSIAVGILFTYYLLTQIKKTDTKQATAEFQCLSWQAPRGGEDCTKCNSNPLQPCSEYRCKSLGQTCKLINQGTTQEKCIDGSRDDTTSPGIKPWQQILTQGYAYSEVTVRPAGQGPSGKMRITNPESSDGCLKPFTPFEFGIQTTETDGSLQEAQCKIEFNHTTKFDDMQYWMGDNNAFTTDHSQVFSLPGTDLLNKLLGAEENTTSLDVKNSGEYTLYIRCRDGNGNENRDEFPVRFCIDKSPDLIAPVIKETSIPTNSPVLYQIDNVTINVYTNEPSNCRWSKKDASYTNMENSMACSNNVWELNADMLYTCTTTLTGIKDREENNFYFRCEDLSKNQMQDSYKYSLFGTQPLSILKVGPNGTISGATTSVSVQLSVTTDNGYKTGESDCYYSTDNNNNSYIKFLDTGSNRHFQTLDLSSGTYTYYYKCIDAGGNSASNYTNFSVYVDKFAPLVLRTYSFESKLYVLTDENSNCYYSTSSCNFDLSKNEGINMPYDNTKTHWAEWKTEQTYYIKCKDKHENMPAPEECSIIVRPFAYE